MKSGEAITTKNNGIERMIIDVAHVFTMKNPIDCCNHKIQ